MAVTAGRMVKTANKFPGSPLAVLLLSEIMFLNPHLSCSCCHWRSLARAGVWGGK